MKTDNTHISPAPFAHEQQSVQRWQWIITGGVQGVGFRPFVYKIAHTAQITGMITNSAAGVCIEIQGDPTSLEQFEALFTAQLPPLARIVSWTRQPLDVVNNESGFCIGASTGGVGHHVLISPDVSTCTDCLADIRDPHNRRFAYPFTNCTNCGPRYTITRSIPYDRASTSMSCFPLCPHCQAEYTNPLDRRFHAQPNACPVCGPKVWLTDAQGQTLAEHRDALERAAHILIQGQILAMKGLGGFHLVCDARNAATVHTLRQRKHRQDKPLAIMVRDLESARQVAYIADTERELLTSRERPIVLLRARAGHGLAPDLSPDTDLLGLMLPYTPLHHVLFDLLHALAPTTPALVMTSGNISADPICLGNREALSRLSGIADAFVLHDRDILIRCDDSVLRCIDDRTHFIRRARGYTPSPIDLALDGPTILGVGPLLKNTLCLTKGSQAFVSQHIGDLENLGTYTFFQEIAAHLRDILRVTPQLVAHDLHPDYLSTCFARESGLDTLAVQHHVAHIHAVLAENKETGPVIGLALDGSGLGEDGTIWGGEAFFVSTTPLRHQRLGHLSLVRMPGGDTATREPWRMARAFLHALGRTKPGSRPWPWLEHHAQADALVGQMLDKGLNSPRTSSCGRLFDAVAGLLGLCPVISYEGQAAIRLEAVQDMTVHASYPCPVQRHADKFELDTLTLFDHVHADWQRGLPVQRISRLFHLGLIQGLAALATTLARLHGCSTVALSGGVLHNQTLATELPALLLAQGLRVLTHHHLPPGDGCISLGQAAYGLLALRNS